MLDGCLHGGDGADYWGGDLCVFPPSSPFALSSLSILSLPARTNPFYISIPPDTRASLPLLACAFFGILSSALFGLRYIALIREATPEPTRTMSVTPAVVRAVPVAVEEVREEVGEEAEREAGEGEALLAAEEGEGGRTAATPPPVPPLAAVTPAEAVPPLFQLPSASPRDKFIRTLQLFSLFPPAFPRLHPLSPSLLRY